MRAYRRLHRRHREEMIKLAKNTYEWDWRYLHDAVMLIIKHFYEYYTEGNNVWQSDESLNTVIEQLEYVLDLDNEIQHLFDRELKEPKDFIETQYKEQELYKKLYSYIGKNLQWWWD